MKFVDPLGQDPGTTRTAFHMLEEELQVALDELDVAVGFLGYILVIERAAEGNLELSVKLSN